jgi:hypothetical protein
MAEVTVRVQQIDGPGPWMTGPSTFRLTWDSTGADTYYLWRDGELVGTTGLLEWYVQTADSEPAIVQVFDQATDVPGPAYPSQIVLCWDETPDTAYYRVERWSGSAWVELTRVEDTHQGAYLWRSEVLADGTAYQYRVTAIGTNGQAGDSLEMHGMLVRHPDPPAVTWTYDPDTGTVEIAAAA